MFPILGAVYQEFFANAVVFDGSNDYLNVSPTGASDGKEFTCSFWIRRVVTGGSGGGHILDLDNSSASRGDIQFDTLNGLSLSLKNSSASEILLVSEGSAITNTAWHHVVISVDLTDSGNRHFLIDNSDVSPAWSTYTNNNIDFTTDADWGIGAAGTGSNKSNVEIAEFWFDDSYIDVGSSNPFYDSGKPADIGLDGSGAGVTPLIYLRGSTDNWHTNKGSGGGCTENGALTTASTSPSD